MSKLLFTSDWQTQYANLDNCEKVVNEIVGLQQTRKIDLVVHCGDFKEYYNPVDVRVVNFGVSTVQRIKEHSPLVCVLGNHDRVGMHKDSNNWLPALQAAGAEVFDKRGIVPGNGYVLYVLPYCSDIDRLRESAKKLAKHARALKNQVKILTFHETLYGCKFNLMKTANDARVKPADLCTDAYDICIGGDVHISQTLGKNIWYVGSPFPINWGEANQSKGYIIYDTVTRKVEYVESKQPRLYDESWPMFREHKPKQWDGSSVRIHVPCEKSLVDVGNHLEKAKATAEKKYVGAKVVVIPEFIDTENNVEQETIKANASDKEKLAAYVAHSCPPELQGRRGAVLEYLSRRLAEATGPARAVGSVKFLGFEAENFLSFSSIKWKLPKGIVLITGKNQDWQGRSNGAGKTTLMQPIPVALFGRTFKNQRANAWVKRGVKTRAFVKLPMILADGRRCEVTRSRYPTTLSLTIANNDASTGNRPSELEDQIEQLTGFTWATLANSIYIDQLETNILLNGTDTQRKEILERFQNLERFHDAFDLTKTDVKELTTEAENLREQLADHVTEFRTLQNVIAKQKSVNIDLGLAKRAVESLTAKYEKAKQAAKDKITELETQAVAVEAKVKQYRDSAVAFGIKRIKAEGESNTRLGSIDKIGTDGNCPVCSQSIKTHVVTHHVDQLKSEAKEFRRKSAEYRELEIKHQRITAKLEVEWRALLTAKEHVHVPASDLKGELLSAENTLEQATKQDAVIKRYKASLTALRESAVADKQAIVKTKRKLGIANYAMDAFHRNGLPAFLNAQLCPRLNRAADYYSQLFADKEIQVRFTVDNGDFDVHVINPNGGETVSDQSTGENKIASLITSFALRDVASLSNILALDEPGDGLDTHNAKQFAAGLKEIAHRFDTILLTTHNPTILGELSGQHIVEVTKLNGNSRLKFVQ